MYILKGALIPVNDFRGIWITRTISVQKRFADNSTPVTRDLYSGIRAALQNFHEINKKD